MPKVLTIGNPRTNQCKKPTGWFGRLILRNMNSRHSGVTDWGLSHISIPSTGTILDVGCGGGRTIAKLASKATNGKVFGIDYSADSVAVTTKLNRQSIDSGRVDVREGSVSHLPFEPDFFDLITAVETHFWWPDLPNDLREVLRVLKPGGTLILIGEVYKGANTTVARAVEKYVPLSGMTLLTPDEHRDLLINAGCSDIQIDLESKKGWISAIGKKPR